MINSFLPCLITNYNMFIESGKEEKGQDEDHGETP